MVNWNAVFKKLFVMIDTGKGHESYFSGDRFIKKVQEVLDPFFPDYGKYIEERRSEIKSTTRRDYFEDILMGFDESSRMRLVTAILDEVQATDPVSASGIRKMMDGGTVAPMAQIPDSTWSASRLNNYLSTIDDAIMDGEYERAVTLCYTCMESFFGAFLREKSPQTTYPTEILELSKRVRDYLREINSEYPGEVLNLITQSAHALNRTRDRFSESHFGQEADRWLASYMRDVVNTQIRLLLHFM